MIDLAKFVTDFADAAVVIPLCTAVALTLLLLGRRRVALTWAAVSLMVWLTMLVLKMAGYTMAEIAPALRQQTGLLTASGHAADAAAAYGALAGLLTGPPETAVRRSCLAALVIALVIGITRVILGDHTPVEAIVGGMVGICGAAAFAAMAREALHGSRRAAVLAATAATLIVLHGEHVSFEHTIAAASARAVHTFLTQ